MKKLLPIVLPFLLSSFSAFGEDQKPIFKLDEKKEEVRQEAIAKADATAMAEVEKVQAELNKKLAEAKRKAAVARIAAREKVIEELTKEKKKAMLAEKLDEALAYKARIEEVQKEVDDLAKEGMDAVDAQSSSVENVSGRCYNQTHANGTKTILGWCFQVDGVLLSPICDSKWGSRYWGTPKYHQDGDKLYIGDPKNPQYIFKWDGKDRTWRECDKKTLKPMPGAGFFWTPKKPSREKK